MTLKSYTKADDVPEGLRGEYKQSGSLWVPDLADDHPVLVLNKTLKQEKDVEEAKVKKLRSDLDDALDASKTSGIPRGHVAVPKADAELLDKYKPHGTPDEVAAKLAEHKTLSDESATRKTADHLKQVAGVLGYNAEAFALIPNLPEFEVRTVSGKQTVVAKLKDDKGVITEKPASEFVESAPHVTPLLPALKATSRQVEVPGGQLTTQPADGGDAFAWARDFGKSVNEANKPTTDLMSSFGIAKSA